MSGRSKWALAATLTMLVLLGASIGVNVRATYGRSSPRGAQRFSKASDFLLPADVGWQVRERTLGETELVSAAALRVLNFSDYVYREYSKPGVTFDVYVAHWRRGQTPTSMVAAHTPDICWQGVGFKCIAEDSGRPIYGSSGTTSRGEWRVFEDAGKMQRHVWYVHLGGGAIRGNGRAFDSLARPLERAAGLWQELRAGSPEQVFVRISSVMSFDRLAEERFFRVLVAHIDRLAQTGNTEGIGEPKNLE